VLPTNLWLLGLGRGDLRMQTTGANRKTIEVHNVLLLGRMIGAIQRRIATVPEEFGKATLK
jgi:hypothetical protein